jgi:hypothetical protein
MALSVSAIKLRMRTCYSVRSEQRNGVYTASNSTSASTADNAAAATPTQQCYSLMVC